MATKMSERGGWWVVWAIAEALHICGGGGGGLGVERILSEQGRCVAHRTHVGRGCSAIVERLVQTRS